MNLILKILFHGIPLIPLAEERWKLSLALLLLVALPYIKTKKLTYQYEELKRRDSENSQLPSLAKTRRLWQSFTFSWLLEKL